VHPKAERKIGFGILSFCVLMDILLGVDTVQFIDEAIQVKMS